MPSPAPQRKPTAAEIRAQRKAARERFLKARKVGKKFATQLNKVARQVGSIVDGFAPQGVVQDPLQLRLALAKYAEMLAPWARNVSAQMISEVDQRDGKAWSQLGQEIGRGLKQELAGAQIGEVFSKLMQEQVVLITSLPIEAANRVHKLTSEALVSGRRATNIAEEIQRSGRVALSRAKLIARTEVARTASVLNQTRAEFVGSESYIWHTAEDSDVRSLHKKHNGKVFRWDDPPVAGENGERSHPGAIYNCRCWAEPILPELD